MAIKMADIVARVTSQTQYSELLAGDKFGFLSAKQYGAVGDGVTDDSAAILTMLTAASGSTNLALYFPTGVYKVDNVTLTSTHLNGYYLFGDNATFSGIIKNIDQVGVTIGKLSDLYTTDKDSIVDSINEVGTTIGNLSNLITTDKDSVVDAINEVKGESLAGLLTTRGDIVTRSSTGTIRVGTGTPLQYIVAGNTSDTIPLKYIDSPQKVMTGIGDLIYASTPNAISRIPIGTNLQTLGVNTSTDGFSYLDSMHKIMTAQGDMIYASSANNPVRLAKGTAYQGLIMNGTTTAPQWAASLQSLMTAVGDIVYASTVNTPARLAIDADTTKVLGISGGLPAWSTKLTTTIVQGTDTSTSVPDGSYNKDISIGVTAKFGIVTIYNTTNQTYFRCIFLSQTSNTYNLISAGGTGSAIVYGESGTSAISFSGTPATATGILFTSAILTGTTLRIVLNNTTGSASTLKMGWSGVFLH